MTLDITWALVLIFHFILLLRHSKAIQNLQTSSQPLLLSHAKPLTHSPGREDAEVVKPSPGGKDQHSASECYKGHQVDLTYFDIHPTGEADPTRHLKQLPRVEEDAVCLHRESDHGKSQVPASEQVVDKVEKHLFESKIQFPVAWQQLS